MKAGLLVCDHVDTMYQEEHGDYPAMFERLFPELEWQHYDITKGEMPQSVEECQVFMTTGSRYSVYDQLDWILRLKQFIRDVYHSDQYMIGVCFGHQLIGDALGGHVAKAPSGWHVGVHSFEIQHQSMWMQPYAESFGILMMCQDQIVELPEDAILLASSESCPNAFIQVGERFLGIQGHPEFDRSYDELLMTLRRDRIGKEVVDSGIKSLERPVDIELLRSWVLRFIGVVR